MKIALVSFEYPPGQNVGGIGTYFYQIANGLSKLRHNVVVFTSSDQNNSTEIINEFLTIIRVKEKDRFNFSKSILPLFIDWNSNLNQFDIIEGPEYNSDTRDIKKQFPRIPLVLKFHTPTFWVKHLNSFEPLLQVKIRFILGALVKFKIPKLYWKNQFDLGKYDKQNDMEYQHALEADLLTSPCLDLSNIISLNWKLNKESIVHIPYPYEIKKELLDIKSNNQTNKIVITFIGRLEIRKGILLLAKVIPAILNLKKNKDVYFRFIGSSDPSPLPNFNMQEYILKKYKKFANNLEFTGRISFEKILLNLSESSICVFPSKWENFPNVCLEAMAASKAIIASQFGGMAEMIENNKSGLLVDPNDTITLEKCIQYLIDNPNKRVEYGQNAREKVLTEYSYDKILNQQVELYNQLLKKVSLND